MKARLIEWAEINSGSHNTAGLLQMASILTSALQDLGADVHLVPLPDADAPAVRARMRPEAPVKVLLSGHFDTVYGESSEFQTCSETEPDVIHGPGVADMKGGLVVMLEALRILEQSEARGGLGWEVLLTPDEEVGSTASTPLLREAGAQHHVGIVFESALPDGSLIGSRKGVGSVRVTVEGQAAHAGRDFHVGRNAIVGLADFITAAHALNHDLPDVIVNTGSVAGGGTINVVPDRAVAEFNIRAVRAQDAEKVLQRMRDAADAIGRTHALKIDVSGNFARPPMEETAAVRALLEAWCAGAAQLGTQLEYQHSGGGSDGNILASVGLPCIDGAGVEGGELHSCREWMRVSSLPRRARIAALFLLRLATGAIKVPATRPSG